MYIGLGMLFVEPYVLKETGIMKTIIRMMLVFLMLTIAAGVAYIQDDMVSANFTGDFDTTINIVSSPAQAQKNITTIQELSQKHNVSFIKDKYKPRNRRNEKKQISIYVYLNDAVWFEDAFPNISFLEDENAINKFKSEGSSTFMTTKEIELIPFSQINENDITGDYHFRGGEDDLAALVEEMNGYKDAGIQATIDSSAVNVSDTTESQFFLYLTVLAIIIASILFCYAIYNGQLTKEMAVARLMGWRGVHFAAGKAIKLVIPSLIIAVVVITVALLYVIQPETAIGYAFVTKEVYVIAVIVAVFFLAAEFILLQLRYRANSIVLSLKGKRPNRERVAYVLKIAICVSAMLMSAISIAGLQDYNNLQEHIPEWKKTANYVNISCGWPWTYVEDDKKFNEVVVPKLNQLWDELDSKGAVMFNAPNAEKEGLESIADTSEPFDGKYAYVNKNYIELAAPVDPNGNKVDLTTMKDNEWIVLYPEGRKPTKEDMEKLKETHVFESGKSKKIACRLLPIKDGQSFLSYDAYINLDTAQLENYTLIVVEGKGLKPRSSIKLPSLVNGYFHPHVEDPTHAYEELKGVICETQTEPYVLWISSVYDDVARQIDEIRAKAIVNLVAFILLILILVFIVRIDIESYLYHHGKRIDVSHLLGYGTMDIHRRKYISSVIAYCVSFTFFIISLQLYPSMNILRFYMPRNGWTLDKLLIVSAMGLVVMTACFAGEILRLCRNNNAISERLKEGN